MTDEIEKTTELEAKDTTFDGNDTPNSIAQLKGPMASKK